MENDRKKHIKKERKTQNNEPQKDIQKYRHTERNKEREGKQQESEERQI